MRGEAVTVTSKCIHQFCSSLSMHGNELQLNEFAVSFELASEVEKDTIKQNTHQTTAVKLEAVMTQTMEVCKYYQNVR